MLSNPNSINFLDVHISRNTNNTLITDIHYKDYNKGVYLPFNSYHPKHILRNIPNTLARRIASVVNIPSLKITRLNELNEMLQNLHYPKKLIKNAINRYRNMDSSEIRNFRNSEKKEIVPFITTYNRDNQKFFNEIIAPSMDLLKEDKNFKNLFTTKKLACCYRMNMNIGRLLCNKIFIVQFNDSWRFLYLY
jgi:hypothetical protein